MMIRIVLIVNFESELSVYLTRQLGDIGIWCDPITPKNSKYFTWAYVCHEGGRLPRIFALTTISRSPTNPWNFSHRIDTCFPPREDDFDFSKIGQSPGHLHPLVHVKTLLQNDPEGSLRIQDIPIVTTIIIIENPKSTGIRTQSRTSFDASASTQQPSSSSWRNLLSEVSNSSGGWIWCRWPAHLARGEIVSHATTCVVIIVACGTC